MPDDVVLNKAATIERCLARIRDVYANDDASLMKDITKQDSIVLNLHRACESAIDLAMHVVRKRGLGIPQESRDAFELLEKAGLLEGAIAQRMTRMVGFRNIAVHDYAKLNMAVVKSIITERLGDFTAFTHRMLTL